MRTLLITLAGLLLVGCSGKQTHVNDAIKLLRDSDFKPYVLVDMHSLSRAEMQEVLDEADTLRMVPHTWNAGMYIVLFKNLEAIEYNEQDEYKTWEDWKNRR